MSSKNIVTNRRQFERILQLIDTVYQSALDDGRWNSLASQIAETFGSTSTTFQMQRMGDSSQILSTTENVRARINDYRAHYWQRDIWVERGVELIGMSRVGSSRNMVSDNEFQETEFYRDWCRHLDVFYVVGAVFPAGPGELGVLGIHRPRSSGAYEERTSTLLGRSFMPTGMPRRCWPMVVSCANVMDDCSVPMSLKTPGFQS